MPGLARSVPLARHCIEATLTLADHQSLYGSSLVLTELVNNAVVHSRSARPGGLVIVAAWEINNKTVRIEVTDEGALTIPRPRDPDATDCHGRGLLLVEKMSARWGVSRDVLGGNIVWAEVSTAEEATEAGALSASAYTLDL
ncbi:ATP-binding protein [Nonomuraea sp. NPDC023979]|uniref:ATP-binding protein n=1 Tax=Nonomuraea sp. NPDC023979 TaxID=3154796 RepID=UPI0033EBFEBD